MSIKLEDNDKNLKEQFKKIQSEIDASFKLIEEKLAKIISDNNNNAQITKDFNNLKKILDETEKNLYEIKNVIK